MATHPPEPIEPTPSGAAAANALALGTSPQDLIRRSYANRPGQRVPSVGADGTDTSLDSLPIPVILLTGQSLATGTNATPKLSTTQFGKCRMLNAASTALVPLVEPATGAQTNNVESPAWGIGAGFETETGQSPVVILDALGATLISQISKGTATYAAAVSHVTAAKNLAGIRGIEVVAVVLINGETDAVNGTEAGYLAGVQQLQADYDSDLRAITGQNFPIPMVLAQNGNLHFWSVAPSSARVQVNLALTEADRFELGSVGYADVAAGAGDAHICNRSSRRRGELLGSAAGRRYLRDRGVDVEGRGWKINAIYRSGSAVRVSVDAPAETMFDTVLCDYKTNYGFEWFDAGDGNTVSITSVKLVSPTVVEIQLSATPTGTNQRVRYAYTGTGGANPGPHVSGSARGNWRSTTGAISAANDSGDDATIGRQLLDWCPIFDLPVTAVQAFAGEEQTITATATVAALDLPIAARTDQGLALRFVTTRTGGTAIAMLRINGADATGVGKIIKWDLVDWANWLSRMDVTGKSGADVIIGPALGGDTRSISIRAFCTDKDYNMLVVGSVTAPAISSVGFRDFGSTAVIAAGSSISGKITA